MFLQMFAICNSYYLLFFIVWFLVNCIKKLGFDPQTALLLLIMILIYGKHNN